MKTKKPLIKRYVLFLIIFTVFTALVSWVAARYIRNSVEVNNTFAPAVSKIPEIEEEFDKNVKENVSFEVGDTEYPVYVRAKLVITWQCTETDSSGNETTLTYFKAPKLGEDYSLKINLTDWEYNSDDGFYYYQSIVPSSGTTAKLIERCEALKDFTDDIGNTYTLSVDIIVQTVQAIGYTDEDNPKGTIPAVEDAWGWETAPAAS